MQFKETSLFDEPESTLRIYRGNRIEALLEVMASLLSSPLSSPFQEEVIIVQSRGMEQWVSLKLAEKLGIAANLSFLHPNTVIWKCCQQLFPALEKKEPFDNDYLTWKLMKLLPQMMGQPEFKEVNHYLEGGELIKRYQLCSRLADAYNRYTVFRPEMILGWEEPTPAHSPPEGGSDGGADWQAQLWREVMKNESRIHYAFLRKMFLEEGRKLTKLPPGFPERINLFGVSSLPPFHVEFFKIISLLTEVNFYLLNPCGEFWFDVSSKRDMARISSKRGNSPETEEELHLEEGNPLLASMGKSGRDLFTICEELEIETQDCYINPGEETALSAIQSDILSLTERGNDIPQQEIDNDKSLQVHSCHGSMREVEVLYDNLLTLIEENPDISPRDILVMAPDIETYTPYIKALFDKPEKLEKRIPYSITDRTVKDEKSAVNVFMKLLDIPESRFESGKLLDILSFPLVRKSFDILESDIDQIETWVRDTRIYWGLDAQHRESFDVPPFSENTWKTGLERLLLGYAMPERGEFIEGVLPYGNIEGNEAQILGKFLDFMERLVAFCKELDGEKDLRGWTNTLDRFLDGFLTPDQEEERDVLLIRRSLQNLSRLQDMSGFSEAVGLDVVRSCLSDELGSTRNESGFITGRVTFCAMLPMRSVPYKVVYLLGMNEGAFPRNVRPLGFDLMAKSPKVGDRSPGSDDRYLFLEALLSARDHFYISYNGRNIQDNSEKQPSILVSELLEYAEKAFIDINGGSFTESIIIQHPLQAFDERYFKKENDLSSFSAENLAASVANSSRDKSGRIFFENKLPAAEIEWKEIDIKDLCFFFQNPAKYFLTKRLGAVFRYMEEAVEEKEAFSLNGLDRYQLMQEILETLEQGEDVTALESIFCAEGKLPHGEPGKKAFAELVDEGESFWKQISNLDKGELLPPLPIDLVIGEFRITGRIDEIYSNGLFFSRPAKVKPTDRLRGWMYHLVLNLLSPTNCALKTSVLGKDASYSYEKPENAKDNLEILLNLYFSGLSSPLLFVPESSLAFIEETNKGKKKFEDCLKKAQFVYQGSEFAMGAGNEPYYQKVFEGIDPVLEKKFPEISQQVFGTLLECESKD